MNVRLVLAYLALLFVLILFVLMFRSSINYETSRVEYSLNIQPSKSLLPEIADFTLTSYKTKDPKQVELFIRIFLSTSKQESNKYAKVLSGAYMNLLKLRPTWPYYYSGLAQIKKIEQNDFNPPAKKAIMLAPFEKKVVMSISQLLFSNWEGVDSVMKNKMLVYLSSQDSNMLDRLISSSLRFARLFEFCDYLYENKQIEYQACKREFWQPLIGKT